MIDWNAVAIHLDDALGYLDMAIKELDMADKPQQLEILRDGLAEIMDDMVRMQQDIDALADKQNREDDDYDNRNYLADVL